MADLPSCRVTPSIPFSVVGLDYAGPISIKQSKIRSSITTKGYISLFVCMSTKALHLEHVSDMSTKTFLNALRRFIARRGKPNKIYSDNGKRFIGAKNKLHGLYSLLTIASKTEIIDKMSQEYID